MKKSKILIQIWIKIENICTVCQQLFAQNKMTVRKRKKEKLKMNFKEILSSRPRRQYYKTPYSRIFRNISIL